MKDIDVLFDEYDKAMQLSTRPAGITKLYSDYIKDENQSVKWNREFVEENNKKYLEEVANLQRKKSFEMNRVQNEIHKYIRHRIGVSEKGAKAIFQFAYEEGHCDGIYGIKDWLFDLMDLVGKCKEN